jgi:hypothetical protein
VLGRDNGAMPGLGSRGVTPLQVRLIQTPGVVS